MLINETFEAWQEIPALLAAITWYDEPDLWLYEQKIGRVTYIHVANIPPTAKLSLPLTIILIGKRDETGIASAPSRRITICGSIFISGVTRHVRTERNDCKATDSNPPVSDGGSTGS